VSGRSAAKDAVDTSVPNNTLAIPSLNICGIPRNLNFKNTEIVSAIRRDKAVTRMPQRNILQHEVVSLSTDDACSPNREIARLTAVGLHQYRARVPRITAVGSNGTRHDKIAFEMSLLPRLSLQPQRTIETRLRSQISFAPVTGERHIFSKAMDVIHRNIRTRREIAPWKTSRSVSSAK
jgi:hypothetical protein